MATVTGTKRHLAITSTTYDSSGDVVVGGNLTVEGTTTTLDTANLLVEDKNIIIGNVSTPSDTTADGGGITLKGASDYTINWVNANNRWEFNQGIYSSGPITSAGQITGTELEGTSLDINGNADISGNLSGVDTLTATTLSVTNYGLVSGDIPNNAANTTGNAATATVADTLQGFDDRDVAPDDISFSEDLKLFFAEKAGIEGGTVASDYQDLLVLNSYADSSGGKLNALAFDKSTHRMLHYNANYNSTDWGTPKEIAYKDSDITGNAATVTSIGNLTGHITSANRVTSLGSFTTAELNAAISDGTINSQNLSGYLLNTTDTLDGYLSVVTKTVAAGGTYGQNIIRLVGTSQVSSTNTTVTPTNELILKPAMPAGYGTDGYALAWEQQSGANRTLYYRTSGAGALSLNVEGTVIASNLSGTNTGDETKARINALDITEVGTISSGVWQGSAISQTYLTGQSGTNTGDQDLSGFLPLSAGSTKALSGDLHYNGSIRSTTPSSKLILSNSSTTTELHAAGSGGIVFKDSGNNTKVTIDSSGNVGIGTTTPSSKLEVYASGSTVLDIQGSQGQLFSITDDLTGDLFTVSDISGVPIFKVNSSGLSTFDGDATFTGTIRVTDGNAATPAYNFSSHTGNGMYLEEYDASNNKEQISISTDGARRFRANEAGIWSDQNVYFTGELRKFGEWKATSGTSGQGFVFRNTADSIDVLSITSAGNATFAGSITTTHGSSQVQLGEYSNGAVIWLDGVNGDLAGGDYFGIHAYGSAELAFSYGAATKMSMSNAGVLTTTGLDINGNADISGNLSGVDTLTATTLSVTNYGLASGDIPNNAANTSGTAAKIKAGGTGPSAENLNTIADSVSVGQLEYRGFSSSTTNAPSVSDNANGVISVGQHSSNYSAQLAFSSNGNMYWRDNPGGVHGSWRKMWDDGNDGATSGLAAQTAATVSSIGNLTGHITSVNRVTSLGSFTTAQLNAAISDGTINSQNLSGYLLNTTDTLAGNLEVSQAANNGNTGAFTNPHIKLTASSTADTTGFVGISAATSTANNYGYTFGAQRTSSGVGDFKINYHNNSAAGTNRFIIDQTGNVGIGTTGPNEKLTVRGTDEYIATEHSSYPWGGANTLGVKMGTDSTAGLLDFRRWTGSSAIHGTAVITQISSDGGYGLDFRVDTKTTNTKATTSRMFISTSGEVGIGTTTPSDKLEVDGDIKGDSFSSDGNARSYTWRALQNTAGGTNFYHRIARITGTQSTRFIIELAGRFTSYGDGSIPAYGKLVGQLNNDNNYDLVYYDFTNGVTGTSQVVTKIGQVDISTLVTDIYINNGQYSEITATAHISDGSITPYDTSNGSTTAPSGYTDANTATVWNSTNNSSLVSSLISSFPKGSTTNYTSAATSGTDAWYKLFQIQDNNSCPIECHIRGYAHTSLSFIASEGYAGTDAHINILDAHVSSTNGAYKFIEGVRITASGVVEILLNGGGTVGIEMTLIGDAIPESSLVISTETSGNIKDSVTSLSTGMIRAYGDVSVGQNLSYTKPTGNNQFRGEIVTFGGQSSIAIGDIVYLNTAGNWAKAQANSGTTSKSLLGVALGSTAAAGILLRGFVRSTNPFSNSISAGLPFYLSAGTAGDAHVSVPTTAGHIARILGYGTGVSAEMYFCPDNTFVEIA